VPSTVFLRQRILFFSLLAMLLFVFVLVFLVFRHFLLNLALSASFAIVLAPTRRRLARALGNRDGLAAGLIVLLVTLLILIPLLGSLAALGSQALHFYQWVRPRLEPQQIETVWRETVQPLFPRVSEWTRLSEGAVSSLVSGALSRLAGGLNGLIQGTVTGLTTAAFELGLFLLMLFFLLRDGPLLLEEARRVSPLSYDQETQLIDRVARTTRASLQAMILVPLAQGLVAIVGYWVIGVPSALLWGGVTLLAAFVPLVGTPLVWIPIALHQVLAGEPWRAVTLALYGNFVISGIDNVIKPKLLQGGASIHPLLGFLAMFGGLMSFGPAGVIVGPVILSLGLAALRIWEMDILGKAILSGSPVTRPDVVASASVEAR
jgi:predicted PurR-regulated permease PerM